MSDLEKVDFALSQVSLVAHSGPETDNVLKWAVRDANRDDFGIVWVGEPYDLSTDRLENPPAPAYWALRKARARAAVEALREPSSEMLFQGVLAQESDDPAVQGIWYAMVDAILKEG